MEMGRTRYRLSRHPSYTGFFYWAIATQLVLGNVVSVVGFVWVLAKFFEARIIGQSGFSHFSLVFSFKDQWVPRSTQADRSGISFSSVVVSDGSFTIRTGWIDEERHLVRFFGQDYIAFRGRVGTWLPAGLVSKEAR